MITFRRTSRIGGLQRVVMFGDSLSAFVYYSKFAAAVEARQARATPDPGLPGPFARTDARSTCTHIWFNSGVAGDDCAILVGGAGVAANVAARVTAYQPDIVFFFIGVNCVQHSVSDAACLANHAAILAAIQAQNPGAQIAALGPLCIQENWPDGANPFDTQLNAKNAIVASTALAAGATYVDLRAPFFLYESLNNPGHLALLGPLTNNDASGLHPNQGAGAQFMSDNLMPYVVCA